MLTVASSSSESPSTSTDIQSFARTRRLLNKEIHDLSWGGNFCAGWKSLGNGSRCKAIAQQTAIVVAGTGIVIFAGGASTFGVLALVQAINDLEEDNKAPIIGHFSEWTMLGVFTLTYYGSLLNEVSLYGREMKIHGLFQKYLNEEDLTPEEEDILYKDYLEFLQNRPLTSWISLPGFPRPFETSTEFDMDLALDRSLEEEYQDLEKNISNISLFEKLKEGWRGSKKTAFLKVTLVAGGILLGIHCINYPLGIVWSAQQAVEDGMNGDNPSIGGHSLEWTVELLATIMLGSRVVGEILNVGKARKIIDLFYEKMNPLQKDGSNQSIRKASRLFEVMKKTIWDLPKGFFCKIPYWQMYREDVEEENAT